MQPFLHIYSTLYSFLYKYSVNLSIDKAILSMVEYTQIRVATNAKPLQVRRSGPEWRPEKGATNE